MENIIRAEDIHKTYKSTEVDVQALKGISLEVRRGEFIAIMGPSGSGKSTLFNILGCLDQPTEGSYVLEDDSISDLSETEVAATRNSKIGFVFQSFNLLPKSSAIENVELPLVFSKKRMSNKVIRELARTALYKVGLEGRESHYPSQLSGGEQQRVAIARAIVNDPLIILADEPTGNLDTGTSQEIMEIFDALNRNGKTIMIITHEPDIARRTRRILYFRDGKVLNDSRIQTLRVNTSMTYDSWRN